MISIQELKVKNNWWSEQDYKITELALPKRDLYDVIVNNFSHSLILSIVGLRRVGKSTLLKQMIGKLLADGIKPKNIFYYLFDYAVQPQKPEFLDDVLSVYFESILKKPVYSRDEQIYVFLDEVQYIEDWQSVLKRHYDLSGKKIKFIVTGSQSVLLKGKYRESLAGRIFDYYLPPMSFREFIKINNEDINLFDKFDLFKLRDSFSDIIGYNTFYGQKIVDLAKEYITVGQFPEIRNIDSVEQKHDYIVESVIGKVLGDCIRVFNIEKTDEFKLVANQLLNNVGSIFELKNLGREAGISFITINNYLEYLKESYLVEVLYKYHKSLIKRGRISKKIYTPCVNFTCALNHFQSKSLEEVPQAFGQIIENIVYNVLKQKYKGNVLNEPISFWRREQKEIDFLINFEKRQLPIEVKFSGSASSKDLTALTGYLREKKLEYGIVITKNEMDKKEINGQTLYFIPYYILLMIV
jgi:hypothetical protein